MNDYFNNKNTLKFVDYPVREAMELMPFLQKYVGGSRTKIKQLLSQRMVYVDKKITTQFNEPLKPGQLVQISNRKQIHDFRNRFVKIVYEDAFIIVVEKASGILTNAQPGAARTQTVKDVLDEYVKRKNRTFSVHTVHRLDLGTSGLLLFAKRRDIQQIFTEHWKEIVSDRRYVALCEGDMEKDSGVVTSWLNENKMFVVYSSAQDNGGKRAVTNYRTLKRKNGYSLVELKLDTGRKNQIRVHMQDLHHPIAGDYKYGAQTDPAGRICLHAFRLEFAHPITGERLKFETEYPKAFMDVMK